MVFAIALAILAVLFLVCLHPGGRVHVSRLRRVLWVCRVSAASALCGLVLFYAAAPARDLLAETGGGWFYWSLFLALVLAWALITHYAGRKSVEQAAWATRAGEALPDMPGQYAFSAAWVPRVLGLLCIVAVALGIHGATRTLDSMGPWRELDDARSQLRNLYWGLAAVAFVFGLIVVFRNWPYRAKGDDLWTYMRGWARGSATRVAREASPFWFLQLAGSRYRAARGSPRGDLTAVVLVLATLLCLLVAFFAPVILGATVPRASFIPLMLGLQIFAFAFMASLAHYLRFPLLLLLVLVLGAAAVWAPGFNDARLLERKEALDRQVDLRTALDEYQKNCRDTGQGTSCAKNPVIVASAGGASRAAFLTATVLGDLLDQTRADPRAKNDFGAQLFAMSGVSGGSVGAAIVRAALADSAGGSPPCKSTDALWFGNRTGSLLRREAADSLSWKGCLQTLAAGDFLSPAIIGLTLRDGWGGLLGLVHWPWRLDDRAALLEQAFEQRFDLIRDEPKDSTPMSVALPKKERQDGLHRPLGDRRSATNRWLPLLLLNATSVETGRRVIASELKPSTTLPAPGTAASGQAAPTPPEARRIFPEAYDLFELLAETGRGQAAAPADIRLSTAAGLSARFPLISPHGSLRYPADSRLADRLVDGGYFENDGVTTAYELAAALREIDDTLTPVILHLTNDPVTPDRADPVSPATSRVASPQPADPAWFESVLNPVRAFFGTRNGHAAEAIRRTLDTRWRKAAANGDEERILYVPFQVFNAAPLRPAQGEAPACRLGETRAAADGNSKIDELAMSWWLSGAVQDYLDRQLCHTRNAAEYEKLDRVLRKTMTTASGEKP